MNAGVSLDNAPHSVGTNRLRYVFIGGLHRSGTSLLFEHLRRHPQIAAFQGTGVPEDEGQHLQTVYPRASSFGGPGVFGFAPQVHLTEASPLASEQNRETLLAQWSPHWDRQRPVRLEKTPQNLLQTRFLQALFPDSSFLVITRHPVAVAYATRKWCHSSLYSLIEHWVHCHEVFRQDRPYLERVQVVRYEDLITDPRDCLRHVYQFLGLPSHPVEVAIRSDLNQKYYDHWKQAQRCVWTRAYVAHLACRFEDRIHRFGYSFCQDELRDEAVHSVPPEHRDQARLGSAVSGAFRIGGDLRGRVIRTSKRFRNRALAPLGFHRIRREAVY